MAEKTYICAARGRTYPVKEDLISHAFRWDQKDKSWKRDCVSEFERRHWESEVENGSWGDVELEFEEEPETELDRILAEGDPLGGLNAVE